MEILGKTAIVTGAASGIGAAVAEALRGRGASVVKVDRTATMSATYSSWCADVTDTKRMEHIFRYVTNTIGAPSPSIVVPCAGISQEQLSVGKDGTEFPPEELDRIIAVNFSAALKWVTHGMKRMVDANGPDSEAVRYCGIFLGSIHAYGISPGVHAYAASKAGLNTLAKCLNLDWKKRGGRCGCLNPGYVETPLIAGLKPHVREALLAQTATGAFLQPSEVADVICGMIENDCQPEITDLDNGALRNVAAA